VPSGYSSGVWVLKDERRRVRWNVPCVESRATGALAVF